MLFVLDNYLRQFNFGRTSSFMFVSTSIKSRQQVNNLGFTGFCFKLDENNEIECILKEHLKIISQFGLYKLKSLCLNI